MLAAMAAAGLRPRDASAVAAGLLQGELVRFPCEGDKGPNGWAVLHLDRKPAGAFGSWKLGIKATWRSDHFTARTCSLDMAAVAARKAQERDTLGARHQKAESVAQSLWQASEPAGDHPYLAGKRLTLAVGGRCDSGRQIVVRRAGSDLLIRLQTLQKPWCNLQRIGADGRKRFLTGGRLVGAFWSAGKASGAPIIAIGEGFATMACVHLSTGLPVAAAMSAGNLETVALALHDRFPAAQLILCADMDSGPQGNIGLEKANAAAAAVPSALVARPPRPAGWPAETKGWDFADAWLEPGGAQLICRALGVKG